MFNIVCLTPEQLVIASSLIAATLSKGLSKDEVDVLANFFSTVSASLFTISAQISNQESQKDKQKQEIQNQIDQLQKQLLSLGR